MTESIDPGFTQPSNGLDESVDVEFSRIAPPEAFAEYIHIKGPSRDVYLVSLLEQFPYLISMALHSAFKAEDTVSDANKAAAYNSKIQLLTTALVHLSDASHFLEGAIGLYDPDQAPNEYHSSAVGSTLRRCAVNTLMSAAGLDMASEQRDARIQYYDRYESPRFLYNAADWLDSTTYAGLTEWQEWLHRQFACTLQLKTDLEQGVNLL